MVILAPALRAAAQRAAPTRLQGVVVATSGGLAVNVNGNTIPARWADPVTAVAGDTVAVDFVTTPNGAEAWVMGRLAAAPRPATGKVATVPAGSPTITVTGSDGATYTATYQTSYTPTVGDTVTLTWATTGQPLVTGKTTAPTTGEHPQAPVLPPPQPPSTGTTVFTATDTATWTGTWSTGGDLYQGNNGSADCTGAWFYSGMAAQLAGRTVTAIRFTLSPRDGAGPAAAPVTVNIYTHTAATRPTAAVTIGTGAATVTAQPWQGTTVYTLPTALATDLLNGGGLCIKGGTYAGFAGRTTNPDTGLLAIDWSR